MKNIELVSLFYQILLRLDVSEIIVCAGARNAPLVVGLDGYAFNVKSYFEERSAGFYALGRIKATQKPVAIITTSGTAVAELLPSVVEAYYQGLPLIVASADRPKEYRGSGAPQSIEQAGIFSQYVAQCYDWDVKTTKFEIDFARYAPLHFNLCFDEPLVDGNSLTLPPEVEPKINEVVSEGLHFTGHQYHEEFTTFKKSLIILGQLRDNEREATKQQLLKNQNYHYAETLSGLKGDPQLTHLQLNNLESVFTRLFDSHVFDSVIRIGGVPTLRFWRDLESKYKNIPVLNISHLTFKGLARHSFLADYSVLKYILAAIQYSELDLYKLQIELEAQKKLILLENKNSEQALLWGLSQAMQNQPVYIGNSLPIREWDLFAQGSFPIAYGNRGANGIDGQISTYLGWAKQFEISWAVFGDLTTLYDLSALGLNQDHGIEKAKRIVVLNNKGGQIFKKVFNHEKFLNTHDLEFSGWAKIWGWDYVLIKNYDELQQILDISTKKTLKNFIIEIQTEQIASDTVWKKMDDVCKNITF